MRNRLLLLVVAVVLMLSMMSGCGEAKEYGALEGSSAAAVVEYYRDLGFLVTDIQTKQDDLYDDYYYASVTMSTDMDEDTLKELFEKEGASEEYTGWNIFTEVRGSEDGKRISVRKMFINDDTYTMGKGYKLDGSNIVYRNILKNGKMFLEDEHYQAYKAQKKAKEEAEADEYTGDSVETVDYYDESVRKAILLAAQSGEPRVVGGVFDRAKIRGNSSFYTVTFETLPGRRSNTLVTVFVEYDGENYKYVDSFEEDI